MPPNVNLPWILVDGGHFQCVLVVDADEIIVDSGNMLHSWVNSRLDDFLDYCERLEFNTRLLSPNEKVNLTPMSMFEWEATLLRMGLTYQLVNNRLTLLPKR